MWHLVHNLWTSAYLDCETDNLRDDLWPANVSYSVVPFIVAEDAKLHHWYPSVSKERTYLDISLYISLSATLYRPLQARRLCSAWHQLGQPLLFLTCWSLSVSASLVNTLAKRIRTSGISTARGKVQTNVAAFILTTKPPTQSKRIKDIICLPFLFCFLLKENVYSTLRCNSISLV